MSLLSFWNTSPGVKEGLTTPSDVPLFPSGSAELENGSTTHSLIKTSSTLLFPEPSLLGADLMYHTLSLGTAAPSQPGGRQLQNKSKLYTLVQGKHRARTIDRIAKLSFLGQ